MAVTLSPLLQTLTPSPRRHCTVLASASASASAAPPTAVLPGRRRLLLSLSAAAAIGAARESFAAEIGLFGIRKGLRKAEQAAEEIVREGFDAAEKGVVAAEKGIVAAEKGIVAVEKEIVTAEKEVEESAVSFNPAAQAGAVAGAELVGVLVATAVVNGILGPETTRS